ncbi:hypothetical protein LCGC14_2422260 [marine sediment metagenome]|uniref:Uncharacterized protein n=1 Tax=marine sediment metagenome TaxID=412755 RepID=A0A0F9BPE8_9ZZZZ
MTMSRKLVVLVLVSVSVGVVGCKKVQTTFVNGTSDPLELQVNGPGLIQAILLPLSVMNPEKH